LRARLEDSSTIVIAMHDGKPLVREGALARSPSTTRRKAAVPRRSTTTLPMFAIETEG
jgi:hypothetical protein